MWWHMRRNQISSYCVWNVMAHAQKPDFVLLRLKCDGTCAETRFRLTAFEMWCHMRRNQISSYCVWNVMAHAQKPDFVFRARRTSPFKSAGGRQFSRLLAGELCTSVCRVCTARASLCSAVMWCLLATHSILLFLLHFSTRVSPCAITFQLDSNTLLWEKMGKSVFLSRANLGVPRSKGYYGPIDETDSKFVTSPALRTVSDISEKRNDCDQRSGHWM